VVIDLCLLKLLFHGIDIEKKNDIMMSHMHTEQKVFGTCDYNCIVK